MFNIKIKEDDKVIARGRSNKLDELDDIFKDIKKKYKVDD